MKRSIAQTTVFFGFPVAQTPTMLDITEPTVSKSVWRFLVNIALLRRFHQDNVVVIKSTAVINPQDIVLCCVPEKELDSLFPSQAVPFPASSQPLSIVPSSGPGSRVTDLLATGSSVAVGTAVGISVSV